MNPWALLAPHNDSKRLCLAPLATRARTFQNPPPWQVSRTIDAALRQTNVNSPARSDCTRRCPCIQKTSATIRRRLNRISKAVLESRSKEMVLPVVPARSVSHIVLKSQPICRGFAAPRRTRTFRHFAQSNDESSLARQGKSEEKFISIRDVVKEATELGDNFIFTDNSEDPVWELESNFEGQPPQDKENTPQVKNALDPNAVDITSAYSPDQGFKEISVSSLHESIEDYALVLDVRSEQEFKSGHVPVAVNLPLPDLNKESVRELNLEKFRDERVAVICASGKRSAQATVRLSKVLGFEDVSNIQGGTLKWISEGFPVES